MQLVGILITDNSLSLSALREEKNIVRVQAHQEYTLDHYAIYNLSIYNPTHIRMLIKNFIQAHNLLDVYIVIALESKVLQEHWGLESPSLAHGYTMQEQSLCGKKYSACLRHEQLLSYKLLALNNFNLLGITTLTVALYYAYAQQHTLSERPKFECLDQFKNYLATLGSSKCTQTSLGLYTLGKLFYEAT